MAMAMKTHCVKHNFESATAACRLCGELFCSDCLVYTNGPSRPPHCVPCALVAAGVRRHSAGERRQHKVNRTNSRHVVALLDPDSTPVATRAAAVGRTRVGLLAATAVIMAVAVPLFSHLA